MTAQTARPSSEERSLVARLEAKRLAVRVIRPDERRGDDFAATVRDRSGRLLELRVAERAEAALAPLVERWA